MLLPALKSARDGAYKIVCVNNLSQISKAQQMYANDNMEFHWMVGFDSNPYDNWAQCMVGGGKFPQPLYLPNRNVLVCPSTILKRFESVWRVYGMYRHDFDDDYNAKKSKSGDFAATTGTGTQIFYRGQKFLAPSSFILDADTEVLQNGGTEAGKPVWFFSPTKLNAQDAAISLLHKGFANCAFVDGHVAGLGKADLRASNTQVEIAIDVGKQPASL